MILMISEEWVWSPYRDYF